MPSNIIISNPQKFNAAKAAIRESGADKLHILADFDRTLTKAYVNGEFVSSLQSILRDGSYLTPDYTEKAHTLFNRFYPIEKDLTLSREEKKKAMNQWWSEHFDLLIKSRLNIKDIKKAAQSKKIRLRNGAEIFFSLLKQNNIPIVFMSSTGLGGESIEFCLKHHGQFFDGIYIVANSYEWDNDGFATGIKKPIIHNMNKDETVVRNFPFYGKVKDRKNVILLGDGLDDVDMIEGFDYDNLIKIGFLNSDIENHLPHYKEKYDVVIMSDGTMDFVNDLLEYITK